MITSAPSGALPVEGPAKHELRRPVVIRSHPSEPMVHERGLSDTTPGNDGNDIYVLASPRIIQDSEIFLSPKNIAACTRQSRYRNFLASQSFWRFVSCLIASCLID